MTPDAKDLAIPPRVVRLCRRLREAGHDAFVVGGGVRDLLIGRPAKDHDLATSAAPDEVGRLFRAVPTGIRFGTVTVLVGPDRDGEREGFEVTTFRGEGGYRDGRRPEDVRFVRTIEEDLSRRDFTINAIACDPIDRRLVDPFGGRADLAARLIRAVGDPAERLREDGLRAMRAVRLAAVLEFAIDPATRDAIAGTLDVFRKVSAERVRDELLKLMAARRPSAGLDLMRETGLLAEVLPELCEGLGLRQNPFHALDVYRHSLLACDETEGDPILRLAALLHDVGKPRTAAPRPEDPAANTFYRHEVIGADLAGAIGVRLKLSGAERERVANLVRHHMFFYTEDWSGPTVRRFVRRVGKESLDDLFRLRAGDVRARARGEDPEREIADLRRRVEQALCEDAALKVSDLAIDGRDVMRLLGAPPGPIVGRVLHALLERVIDDPALNTREALEPLVAAIAASEGTPGDGPGDAPERGGD